MGPRVFFIVSNKPTDSKKEKPRNGPHRKEISDPLPLRHVLPLTVNRSIGESALLANFVFNANPGRSHNSRVGLCATRRATKSGPTNVHGVGPPFAIILTREGAPSLSRFLRQGGG